MRKPEIIKNPAPDSLRIFVLSKEEFERFGKALLSLKVFALPTKEIRLVGVSFGHGWDIEIRRLLHELINRLINQFVCIVNLPLPSKYSRQSDLFRRPTDGDSFTKCLCTQLGLPKLN
jgi:hypothetical protein